MPQIPVPQITVPANVVRPSRTYGQEINFNASPDAYGAQVGTALQNVGTALDNVAGSVQARIDRTRQEDIANAVAQSDFTQSDIAIKNAAAANGAGLHDQLMQNYDANTMRVADTIHDPVVRQEYINRMHMQRESVAANAAAYQANMAATNSKDMANASLDTLQNRVVSDPTFYGQAVEQGNAVIDARPDLTPTFKASMKTTWAQDSAKAHFEGMLEGAKSIDDIDNISKDITGLTPGQPDWASKMSPVDYHDTINKMGVMRREFQTAADVTARAALDTLDARNAGNQLIDPAELAAAQKVVLSSLNPVTQARMARITRDQVILSQTKNLTPAEIQGQISAANGNPSAAYPGMPPVVSNGINAATSRFDVSASYLGSTVNKEYGQYLKAPANAVDAKFAPQAISGRVDLRNVQPAVIDAATQAGKLYGAPLQIISGERSQAEQDAIRFAPGTDPNRATVAKVSMHTSGQALDISIAGMSDVDQGRLVGALVDSGFTGIGQYDTHIHADMRAAVPASFGQQNGKDWGGWTYLSPAVADALKSHGFAGGATAESIKRAAPVQTPDNIDYTRGTSSVSATGQATSDAKGIMQFTSGTWLGLLKDPATAKRIGVDTTGMSDEKILALRDDPQVSIMAGAALAEKDKATLQGALGRQVPDAELYMAHFLGAGGAITLIHGNEAQPNQSAAKLLPDAAAANRGVFYNKDGSERTVSDVYNGIATSFVANPTQVTYGDNQKRQAILTEVQKGVKDDPMLLVQQNNQFNVVPLSDTASFTARGQSARATADYYSISVPDMKPFTADEAAALKKSMDTGTADTVLKVMGDVNQLGGDMARAGFKQLGQIDPTFAYAAGLATDGKSPAVAADIIRGEKDLKDNPAIKDQIGADSKQIAQAFSTIVGNSMSRVDPIQRQAVQDAAFAHYTHTVAIGGSPGFDQGAFAQSVQAVLGSTGTAKQLDAVNGQPTVLPPGITGPQLDDALNKMSDQDWTTMSPDKAPPLDSTGEVIPARRLADEATLRFIGGGKYNVALGDNTFAINGQRNPDGSLQPYVFQPTPDKIDQVVSRPATTGPNPADFPQYVPRGAGVNPLNYPQYAPRASGTDNLSVNHLYGGYKDANGRWVTR